MALNCTWPKGVHVNQYLRWKKGRLEVVREHCRSK